MEWVSGKIEEGGRSDSLLPFESAVPGILAILHGELRQELQAWKDKPDPGRRNAKGDLQRSFDLAADEYVRSYQGCVVDRKGNRLGAFAGLEQRTSLIAAASFELAKEIANVLDSSGY